jgi:RimJ/RimL family protein N-acetyltransferase
MRFSPRLTTPRTVLRAWNAADGAILKAAIDHNKDHLKPWVPWANGELTPLEETERRVATFAEEFAAGRNWLYAVLTPDEQRVIGGTGLHDRIGPGGLEVGYWIDRDHINQGLATEVAGAISEVAFTAPELQFLEMHIDARNTASARVPQRLGYTMAELRQEPRFAEGEEMVSMMIWRLQRGER